MSRGNWKGITSIFAALVGMFALLAAGTAQATTYTVDTLNDTNGASDCSLRDAIDAANGSPNRKSSCSTAGTGTDTIVFSVTGTIRLMRLLPGITDASLTINGPTTSPGITIDAGHSSRVLYMNQVSLNVNNLTIVNGRAIDLNGGGIGNLGGGKLTVTNCTFSSNSADLTGGAIWFAGSDSTLTVTNSSFYNNSSRLGGGAIFDAGTLNVTNSTFSGNSANSTNGGGIFVNARRATANVKGTILAGNTPRNCFNSGTLNDDGYNISSDDSCGFKATDSANNGDNVNPMLNALGSNGGPTMTFALKFGSPAIDAIPPDACTYLAGPNPCTTSGSITDQLTCDQRGFIRPALGQSNCDIGAVEGVAEPSLGAPGDTCPTEGCDAQKESCVDRAFSFEDDCLPGCKPGALGDLCRNGCGMVATKAIANCSLQNDRCVAKCG